jgi:hypothetical protein
MLETDHLVAIRAGAKAREPILIVLADLLLRHRRRRNPYRGITCGLLLGIGLSLLGLGALASSTIAALSPRRNAFQ